MEVDPHPSTDLRALELPSSATEPASEIAVPAALPPGQLRRTDISTLNFKTTAELQPLDGLIGQHRALGALRFGTQI